MTNDPSQFRELPSPLPEGERVLWQGKPTYKGLAIRSFHMRAVAIYFVLLIMWKAWSNWSNGQSPGEALASASTLLIPAIGGLALLALLTYLFRRASCYTITSKRVLIQTGVALPVTLNIPLSKIANADLSQRSDGSGDIPLRIIDSKRTSYVLLWPHIRPWRLREPEPMMTSVPDVAVVAAKLTEAVKAQLDSSAVSLVQTATSGPKQGPLSNSTATAVA
ncbi:photosynthetic complex putative assembly protein PuhB [Rhodopseudomonas pseudopalustris]|uniref:PH domain-containing protein n=1 Tax=Rhodopseudomonas pseudopalustris TaxID=1513892 RepID=A0A1H8R546_9BRAD|nr:photosynthetic complex putative assembly protein PuhB [Rhodopseudomonas pseudopalustris]MBB1091026.1 PH domain-containing protein [Rhodopseudomonas palustris]SEO61043.1 PH domain-containing protein [Rhodopseudomonas pseudopalustris]